MDQLEVKSFRSRQCSRLDREPGVYTIGDSASPDTANAFTITNQDNKEHTVTLSESIDGVDFTVYTSEATDSFTQAGSGTTAGDVSVTLSSGSSAFVVMELDTTGMTDSDTISGTLNVDA